ncbi:MAG: hypothetical protein ABII82_06150 [Verrucomicrobiota bacterium]
MSVNPRLRRHLPLVLLLGTLVAWPMIHQAPPATCPPGTIICPLDKLGKGPASQLVIIDRPQ